MHIRQIIALTISVALLNAAPSHAAEAPPVVTQNRDGALQYVADERGNRVPDFSTCGYLGGRQLPPSVAATVQVKPSGGDDTAMLQAAVDQVSSLPLRDDGFRGAVWMQPGTYRVSGQIRLNASGVVLRGSGATDDGTVVIATGTDRRALIAISSPAMRVLGDEAIRIVDDIVPVGATAVTCAQLDGLSVGQTIRITRPSTEAWIKEVGADAFGVGWRPGSRDLVWERTIKAIDGNTVRFEVSITTAIEQRFGGATITVVEETGRVDHVGIEDLQLTSAFDTDNPFDEQHAWHGVVVDRAEDSWIRRVAFKHFAGGAVRLADDTRQVSVEDCIASEPVAEIGGFRRHTYETNGQQTLFLRCWSEGGCRDFVVGHCVSGPNAFVNCFARHAHGDSGPIGSWANGVLYDNVRIDGGGLHLRNQWSEYSGTGWAAANCMLWQCRAAQIDCFRPPTAQNWANGIWAELAGDGYIAGRSDEAVPMSLFQAQLADRFGANAAKHIDPLLGKDVSATSPTLEQAAAFVARSNAPATQLIDVIRENMLALRADLPPNATVPMAHRPNSQAIQTETSSPMLLQNGWLTVDGAIKTGGRLSPTWWRGTIRPAEATSFGPAITRFSPGRSGIGLTDDIADVIRSMHEKHVAVYDHHYGLWYDRRRDDHLMVRRADGNVWPPFYEQPFARTGKGKAWDGLSLYDLTKYNPWYWNRLHEFAKQGEQYGLVLIHQNYFQHNILEAGAHWVDCPWRTVNNVNDTDFPEPPPFIGDKRIFLAHHFYDVTHPQRRQLHRAYIRQCLDNFADCGNVIQMTSGEYTGPLEFTQFWLDTIVEWEREHGKNVIVGLSCTKDVQDAILSDGDRSHHVDVVDIRYWSYQNNGETFAPMGGANMAPRQHIRQLRPKPTSFASIVRAVREYRQRFPEKAVTYYADAISPGGHDGWAVVIGGGSLADLPTGTPRELLESIPTMLPAEDSNERHDQWLLASAAGDVLIYQAESSGNLENIPIKVDRSYTVRWLDTQSGEIVATQQAVGRDVFKLNRQTNVVWLTVE
ncbi:MAG: DUF6298 domain-containing protein [Pirellulaceae bacterium]|nr:hypothetical protein [Planctomycetales bacterium]